MQGHLPHNNPVQKHSAGDIYPYVLAAIERAARRYWTVIGPGTSGRVLFQTHREAEEYALWMKADRSFVEFPA